jgi:hypothetical protein
MTPPFAGMTKRPMGEMNTTTEEELKRLRAEVEDARGILRVLWDQLEEPWPRLLAWLQRNGDDPLKS